jgi:predicted transposase YdaD
LQKGLEEGVEKGRAGELERIVTAAGENKLSVEKIRAITGLSDDDIREILKRNEPLS